MDYSLLIPGFESERACPDFTRLRDAVTRTGRGDRLPFLELFADREIMEAVLGKPLETYQDQVEFQLRLGYDTASVGVRLYFPAPRTPLANTAELAGGERQWVTDNTCPIQTREAFERYEWPDPESVNDEHIEAAAAALPEGMGLILQSSGVLENVMWLMGYTGLASAIYDDPDLVKDMFDAVGSRVVRAYKKLVSHPAVGGVFLGEDMGFKTATMISPEHLRKYHFPYLRQIVDAAHELDKFAILHSCGNLADIMDDLIDYCGFDAKHSYEDAIMPVAEFKKVYGDRISVVGGVDVDALSRLSADDMRAYVRRVLEECAPGGGYVLGSGNSVTNYVKLENYLIMLQEGWRFRKSLLA